MKHFDLVIIGAGPAGLMAAISTARHHPKAKIAILEKNSSPGKKLLCTGNGRCNISNATFDIRQFLENYGKNGKFLFNAFEEFGPKETIEFFEKRAVKTVVEPLNKVFPKDGKAQTVLNALLQELKKSNVEIITELPVTKFKISDKKILSVLTTNQKYPEISADNFILATGGKSHPITGSTGDGYLLATSVGHTITPLSPALTPLKIKENWILKLQGLTLNNIKIDVYQNKKKQFEKSGDLLFTHFGISSPTILLISKRIGELLKNGEVKLKINLFPNYPIDQKLSELFTRNQNKDIKNCLSELKLTEKFITTILKYLKIPIDKKVNILTRQQRKNILEALSSLTLSVDSLCGFNQAVVTCGGINLKEIDPKTMRSRLIKNLYFAGEIIDIDGPTGGYNLQTAWSTGYLAGEKVQI